MSRVLVPESGRHPGPLVRVPTEAGPPSRDGSGLSITRHARRATGGGR